MVYIYDLSKSKSHVELVSWWYLDVMYGWWCARWRTLVRWVARWGRTLVRWVARWGRTLVRWVTRYEDVRLCDGLRDEDICLCDVAYIFSVVTRNSWTWVDKRQWHNWMTLLELGTSQFTCWGCWFSWWCWWCMFVCLWGHVKPIWKSINVYVFSVGSNCLGDFWDSTNAMQP